MSEDGNDREMTLEEWVERLPPTHQAVREYYKLSGYYWHHTRSCTRRGRIIEWLVVAALSGVMLALVGGLLIVVANQ